ncbi:MAG: alpha/beta hydrolase [Lactobacillus sp.]|uniref:alpha/beta hydrolase n=1 Tax=Lactobacillus sp. TaxID=1591 RepID=UPI0023BD3929|nr:alpha/beta hydrolase [Lactobacillus sp.]MDE7051014.1 alpha/beta hydrolase [Lactobacillus sp.]
MKVKLVFLLTILAMLLTSCTFQNKPNKADAAPKYYVEKRQTPKSNLNVTPTLFFHGGLSNYHGEENMVKAAQNAGVTNSVIRADVDANGKVKLIGTIPKNAVNPIVEVNYRNNVQLDFKEHGRYARNVVQTLQNEYGIKKVNMVGHSLGNISIMYYLLQTAHDSKMPKLNKQVAIAGHFDGLDFKQLPIAIRQPSNLHVDGQGKPNKTNATYREMMKLRTLYPAKQTDVLNIIGNIGRNSDGIVKNASSLSLEYLVAPMAKTYRVVTIVGKNAEHGQLTYNKQVERDIINFLWLQ